MIKETHSTLCFLATMSAVQLANLTEIEHVTSWASRRGPYLSTTSATPGLSAHSPGLSSATTVPRHVSSAIWTALWPTSIPSWPWLSPYAVWSPAWMVSPWPGLPSRARALSPAISPGASRSATDTSTATSYGPWERPCQCSQTNVGASGR